MAQGCRPQAADRRKILRFLLLCLQIWAIPNLLSPAVQAIMRPAFWPAFLTCIHRIWSYQSGTAILHNPNQGIYRSRLMRNHKKLRAFELADELVMLVYRTTASFPRSERYGLAAQIRRAAVSVPSNIVEGCARYSESEYIRFLDIALSSARELQYQISLAIRLDYIQANDRLTIERLCDETNRVLNGLQESLRRARQQ